MHSVKVQRVAGMSGAQAQSVNTIVNGYLFFESREQWATKGEVWFPLSLLCIQDTVGL